MTPMCVCSRARTTGNSQWHKPEIALKLLGQDDLELVNPEDRVEGGGAYAEGDYEFAGEAVAAANAGEGAEGYTYDDTGGY